LIFVGEAESSDDRPGTFRTIRLLGFVPAGGPFRQRPGDFVTRVPTAVPALGFASFRVAVAPIFVCIGIVRVDASAETLPVVRDRGAGSSPLSASSTSGPRISRRPIRS
jgi:hypothetical protein